MQHAGHPESRVASVRKGTGFMQALCWALGSQRTALQRPVAISC